MLIGASVGAYGRLTSVETSVEHMRVSLLEMRSEFRQFTTAIRKRRKD